MYHIATMHGIKYSVMGGGWIQRIHNNVHFCARVKALVETIAQLDLLFFPVGTLPPHFRIFPMNAPKDFFAESHCR